MKIIRGLSVIFLSCAALIIVQWTLHLWPIAKAAPSRPGSAGDHVIISEVFYDPAGVDNGLEWVELYNPTSDTIDLSDYSLGNGGNDYIYSRVQLSGTLLPQACWIIGGPTTNITNNLPILDQTIDFSPDFQNGGTPADGIALFAVKAISITSQTVPIDAVIYGTANASNLIDETGVANSPDVGTASSGKSNERTDITGTWTIQSSPTPNSCAVLTTTISPPPLTPPGSALISAVHFDGLAAQDNDEGFRLTNVSTQPMTLTSWVALYSASQINLTGTLQPGQAIWLAKQAGSFEQQFGFKPDYEYDLDTDAAVPNLSVVGSVPTLGPNAELTLREGGSNYIDVVVWGGGQITDTGWISGWVGSNVQRYSNGDFATTGQILFRKLDEATGAIVTDTNTALDWANDRTDPLSGRKAQYPGWSLEKLWQTAKVTETAALTVAISPDNAFRVISGFLGAAQHSIVIEMHSFDNLALARVITEAQGRGVSVTILLEGAVPGTTNKIADEERWVCQHIEAAGGQCWFMINDSAAQTYDRYDYVHAKMIIVDGRTVAIGSENFSPRSLTYDDFADGTAGHRGVYLLTNASGVVSRALDIWQTDFDPARYHDLYRWNISDTTYGPIGYTPIFSLEVGGYKIRFPQPFTVTAPLTFELLTAPESAVRAGDSLLGLIDQSGAGDTIDVEQLDEPPYWGSSASNPIDDPNVRLEALIHAASRGTQVRLLLDRYFDDSTRPTSNAATRAYLETLRDLSPTLTANLEVRLGDPADYGLHNKLFLFNVGGHKWVHAGSLNGTETSNKVNREVALQVESAGAYDYLRAMFDYDWAWQPRVRFPLVLRNYQPPPNYLLISKVFYLGSTSITTGSEWVQIYNPTPITISLSSYKLGDQAVPGVTTTVDGMWRFPANAIVGPGQVVNVATTGAGFFQKYGFPPNFAFYDTLPSVPLMTTYLTYTQNISFALANSGDEVLLRGPADQLVDGVAWGTGALPGNISCIAIDPTQYPLGNPSIKRDPLWKDTNNCPADFVIDPSALP